MPDGYREQILSTVRQALRKRRPLPATLGSTTAPEAPAPADLAQSFARELKQVGGYFTAARSTDEVKHYLAEVIRARRIRSVALSDAPLFGRLGLCEWATGQVERLVNVPAADVPERYARLKAELSQVELGLTTCRFGLADTGTLVLDAADETHRLVSLLPTYHVALLAREQLLPNLAEALRRLQASGPLSHGVTLITGPSRTGDIELTLTVGVHGPREVHVVLIDFDAGSQPGRAPRQRRNDEQCPGGSSGCSQSGSDPGS